VIGAIDGPTSIFVQPIGPNLLARSPSRYSYMSLVPIIQPPLMRLLTTRDERRIRMIYALLFPSGAGGVPHHRHGGGGPRPRPPDWDADAGQLAAESG
jgi:hypothetical protein